MDAEKRIEQLENEFKELKGFANEARASLEKLVADFKDHAEEGYDEFKDSAEDVWDDAKSNSKSLWKQTRRGAKKAYYNTIDYSQEHPWRVTTSALALLGVVGVICYLASERSNSQLETLKRRYRNFF